MHQPSHLIRSFVLGAMLFGATGAVASVTNPDCGGRNQRACTLFDSEFWANNSGFCDFGLKSNKGVLAALSGGAAGTCVNDTRETFPKDNSWVAWALSEQRYGIQKNLPVNYITHLGTHNSFSNYADKDNNWLSTNQQYSITDQLNLGARVIRIDPHYYFGELRLCHAESNSTEGGGAGQILTSCASQAVQNYLPVAIALLPNLPAIHLLPQPIPTIIDAYLADILGQAAAKKNIVINNRLFVNGVREMADWLSDNPDEFIVLMMNDYAEGHDSLINDPIKTFLGNKVWTPANQNAYAKNPGWPTMQELRNSHKQLIIFSNNDDHGGTWIFKENTYVYIVYPKKKPSGSHNTDSDLTDNSHFAACQTDDGNYFQDLRFSTTTSDHKYWFQTGEGRTGSDYLGSEFTGTLDETKVKQAVKCGFSTIRLDFWMALDRAYSKYRQSEPDQRREAAVWSYAQDDFGRAGPAVMNGATGRWTSVNAGQTMRLACANSSKPRNWAVSTAPTDYFSGQDSASDPCTAFPGFRFAAPQTAAENQDLFTAVKAAGAAQVMLYYSAVAIPPAYVSPSYTKQFMDRGDLAPDQVVEQVNGIHELWFRPELTTNESGALNIVEPTSRTPLSGGFVPFVLEYDQVHAQNLPTGSYSAMATMNLYTSPATNLFFPYPLLPDPNYHPPASAINLQVMEPTRTRIAPTPPQVVINGKATFTVTVGPQCGAKPAAPPSRGSNTITGGVEFMDTYQPDYGGEPVTMRLGTIPINNSPSDARDNDNGVMHAVIDGTCATDDTVCAYTLSLGRGRHNITALYHGDDLYGASTSATHIIDVVDPIVPGGVINLTLGSKPSQVVTLTGFPGESFQIFAPPLLSVTPSSGKFVTNSVPVTVAIVDSPTLLPGVINTTFNAVGTLSNGTLFSDTYQQVKITVPTTLSVQQTPLNFTAVDNTPSSGQGIAVTYLGGPLTITPDVSTPQAWIAAGLSTASLTSRGIQTARVAVEVNPAGLAPGHYTGVVRIGAPSGPGVFSVPVSLDVTLSAPHYTITTTPPGLRVVVDGVNQATPVTFQWTTGSRHTLSTPAGFQPAGDGTRAIWTAWSDGGAIAHAITANGSKDYMATFRLQYQLTTQRSPVCGGTVTPTGNWVNAGALAQISASAASGYTFGSFTGDVSSSASSASLLMNQPHSVIANFKCPGGPCTDVLPVTYATGDLNRDGRVDCTDVAIVKAALGKRSGQAGFDARADVNGDGVVDVRDLSLVSQQLPVGSTCQ